MDERKEIKINFGSDKKKHHKTLKEKGQEHPESNELKEGVENSGASSSEMSEEKQPEVLAATKTEDLERLLKEKEEECSKEHDRLLRTLAEFENYKKRMAREKADSLKFGNESLIKELLSVLDNLERSVEHVRNATSADAITEGIELVIKEFLKKLEKFGLSAISARKEKFDPNKHEAVFQVETAEQPEDTVVDEYQKGYLIYDRLLRPAKVSVAKAPRCPED